MHIPTLTTFLLLLLLFESQAQGVWTQHELQSSGFVTTSVNNTLKNSVSDVVHVPPSLPQYSSKQLQLQEQLNTSISESVVAYSPLNDPAEWTDIDREDITPYTWRWVDLQKIHTNGDTSQISLRRPVKWLKEVGAHQIGDEIMLDLPEMGITGPALVTNIRPNQLDTRVWSAHEEKGYTTRPITGKFAHHSSDVYDLYFGKNVKPVGVTGNHRFWSIDRNVWVVASALEIGERIKSKEGWQVLNRRIKRNYPTTVYNLEVYRIHNYMVSGNALLVHNECWSMHWNKIKVAMGDEIYLHSDVHMSGPLRVLIDGIKANEMGFEMMGYEMGSLISKALRSGKNSIVVKVDITNLGMFDKRRLQKQVFTGRDIKRVGKDEVINGKTYRTWEFDISNYPDFSRMNLPSDEGHAQRFLDDIMKDDNDDD